MVDPGTAILIATAISTAAQGAGKMMGNKSAEQAAKMRAKETKRETQAGMFNEALQRSADLEAHRLHGRKKLGKRSAQSMQETADLVRGAFNI